MSIRWKQRFNNFEKAYKKFTTIFNTYKSEPENEIYQLALVQTFEFTYELSWKVMKDFMQYNGVKDISLPREIIKKAFQHEIIQDGQTWVNMLEDRNIMSHTYNEENAKQAMKHISEHYIEAITKLYTFFKKQK